MFSQNIIKTKGKQCILQVLITYNGEYFKPFFPKAPSEGALGPTHTVKSSMVSFTSSALSQFRGCSPMTSHLGKRSITISEHGESTGYLNDCATLPGFEFSVEWGNRVNRPLELQTLTRSKASFRRGLESLMVSKERKDKKMEILLSSEDLQFQNHMHQANGSKQIGAKVLFLKAAERFENIQLVWTDPIDDWGKNMRNCVKAQKP